MKVLLGTAVAALSLAVLTPASAQILGGGATGQVGGSVTGTVRAPDVGSTVDRTTTTAADQVDRTTTTATGTVNGATPNANVSTNAQANATTQTSDGDASLRAGLQLRSSSGEAMGTIERVVTDAEGRVTGLMVRMGDTVSERSASGVTVQGGVAVAGDASANP